MPITSKSGIFHLRVRGASLQSNESEATFGGGFLSF